MLPDNKQGAQVMPDAGAPKSIDKVVEENRSILNPIDAEKMINDGTINKNMSVRDFFGVFGIDVDGPVTQLTVFFQDQAKKGDPLNKMKAFANASPAPGLGPVGEADSYGGSSSGGTLDSLMSMGGSY